MQAAVIGVGYWGPNLVRNLHSNEKVKRIFVFDIDSVRLKLIKNKFPGIHLANSLDDIWVNDRINLVFIATPVHMHYNLAIKALEAGKHIWVEKPFTLNVKQAEELINLSEKKGVRIFVDHTFIYTDAVRKVKEIVDSKLLGKLLYFDSVRINLGIFQTDVNVIWDLATHDLSILKYLIGFNIKAISAHGIAHYLHNENIAHISIYFEQNCFAHIHVNWTSPVKIRRILIGGSEKMLFYDDLENVEKIRVFDSSIVLNSKENIYEALVQYRMGDMYSPRINQTEALTFAVEEFISAVEENRTPLTSGYDGLEIVRLLEMADYSLKHQGKIIYLDSNEE
ncbi:MAG: Gfo/Idh/MocA family protein [Ignavibacteria bacterium]